MTGFLEKTDYWWDVETSNRYGNYMENYEKTALDRALALLSQTADKAVLDLGCGSGGWSVYLQKQSKDEFNAIGVDINKDAVSLYRKRVPAGTSLLVSPDSNTLPLEDGSMNLIIAYQGPFINPWFLKEAYRVLNKDGMIAGTLLNKASWRGVLQRVKSGVLKTENPFKLSFKELTIWSGREGFDMIFARGFGWIPVFSWQMNSPLIPTLGFFEKLFLLGRIRSVSPSVVFILRKRRYVPSGH